MPLLSIRRSLLLLLAVFCTGAVIGCTGGAGSAEGTISPEDFRGDESVAAQQKQAEPADSSPRSAQNAENNPAADQTPGRGRPVTTSDADSAEPPVSPAETAVAGSDIPLSVMPDENMPRVLAVVGDPETEEDAATLKGKGEVVDLLVGQINGRPIYADEVFKPIDARLRAAARKVRDKQETPRWFDDEAAKAIMRRLSDMISSEVYLSEAEASLPEDQRLQTLDYFKQLIRNDTISRHGRGSVEQADRWTRDNFNMSLDQYVEDQVRSGMISREVHSEVISNITVSWREIVSAYYRQYDRFHPKPLATIRILTIPNVREEPRKTVEAMIAEGKSITDILESGKIRPVFFRASKGEVKVALDKDSSETNYFPEVPDLAPFNEALKQAKPGDTLGPIEFNDGRGVGWVTLVSIEQRPVVSLYDAQQVLRQEIMEKKRLREFDRFEKSLITSKNYTDMRSMASILLEIARERYLAQ